MVYFGYQQIKVSFRAGVQGFRPEILLLFLGFIDMILLLPFVSYEMVRRINDFEWMGKHRELSIMTEIHMVSALICGTISIGLVKYIPRLHILLAFTERMLSIIMLHELMLDVECSNVEEGLKWTVTVVASVYMIFDLIAAVRFKDLEEISLRFPVLLLKIWLPAVLLTSLSALFVQIPVATDSAFVFEMYYFVMYTLGMEFLMATSYFVTIYETIQTSTQKATGPYVPVKGRLNARSDFV